MKRWPVLVLALSLSMLVPILAVKWIGAQSNTGLDIKGWKLGVSLDDLRSRWTNCRDEPSMRFVSCRGYSKDSGWISNTGFIFYYSTGLDPKIWKISYNYPDQACKDLVADVQKKYKVGTAEGSGAVKAWKIGEQIVGLSPTMLGLAGCHVFIADLDLADNNAKTFFAQCVWAPENKDKQDCGVLGTMTDY